MHKLRVAAILRPGTSNGGLQRFRAPGVEVSAVEELRPEDGFDAVLIFGGDGSIHRQLAVLKTSP